MPRWYAVAIQTNDGLALALARMPSCCVVPIITSFRSGDTDAKSESRGMEDLLPGSQVSRSSFLPNVTAGPCAAVGCAQEASRRRREAPERATPRYRRRLTIRRIVRPAARAFYWTRSQQNSGVRVRWKGRCAGTVHPSS
jgi:hypothetical protein